MSSSAFVISTARHSPRQADWRGLSLSDCVLFWPGLWLACALGAGIRLIGILYVVLPVGLCLLYALIERVVPPRLLTVYLAFCAFAAALSKYGLFPSSWQSHFMEEAILKQFLPTLGFFAVGWAAKAYFRKRFRYGNVFVGGQLAAGLGILLEVPIAFYLGLGYQGDYSLYQMFAALGSFLNNTLISVFFITGYIYFTKDWRRYFGLCTVFMIAAITHFAQFRLWTLLLLATFVGVPARKALTALIAVLIVAFGVAINFGPQLMTLMPNEGLRAIMMHDGLLTMVDTDGIGIGYGKEAVRNRYKVPGEPDFRFLPDWDTMSPDRKLQALSNTIENSFFMTLLHTGIIGLCLLLSALFAAFPPRGLPRNAQKHAVVVFGMMIIASSVNAGLDTPLENIGLGFLYGYLLALRAWWHQVGGQESFPPAVETPDLSARNPGQPAAR